jgi:chemotaxis protein CheC
MRLELSEAQLDALNEVGTIGAGHASTALSQMTTKKILIKVPTTNIVELERVPEIIGGAERLIVGTFFQILGDVRGDIMLVFTKEQAIYLANTLLGKEGDPEFLTEEKESALKELGNILVGSYLNALSALTGLTSLLSVPHLSYDMAGAVVDPLIVELAQKVEDVLVIETEFIFTSKASAAKLFVFFDSESFSTILKAIGMDKG